MRSVARLVAAGISSLLLVGVLPGIAHAAGSLTVQSPASARHFNDGSTFDLVLQGTGPYLPNTQVSVKLANGPGGDTKTFTGTASGTNTVTASAISIQNVNIGSYDLQTVVGGNVVDQCSQCFTADGYAPSGLAVSPGTLAAGTSSDSNGPGFNGFTISGQGFTDGPYTQCTAALTSCAGTSVALVKSGQATGTSDITLVATKPSATNATPTAIALRINVSTAASAVGTYDVVVFNAAGKSATCSACLQIVSPLTVSSVRLALSGTTDTLSHIGQNATGQTLLVTGQNLPSDAMVSFAPASGSGAGAGSITSPPNSAPATSGANQVITVGGVDTTQVTTPGAFTVTVTSASLHASTTGTLTVSPAPSPDKTSFTHVGSSTNSFGQGAQGVSVRVGGSGLDSETPSTTTYATRMVLTSPPSGLVLGAPTVAFTTGTTNGSGTVTMPVTVGHSVATGSYPFKLVNPDGGTSAVCDNSTQLPQAPNTCQLTISTGPSLTSISPATVAAGASNKTVTLTGTGFHSGATVTIGGSNSGITVVMGSVTATSATVTVTVPSTVAASALDVVLTNNDDVGQDTLVKGFTVANLSVDSVNPTSWTNDQVKSLTLSGTNLSSTQTTDVRLVKGTLPPVVGSSIASVGSSSSGVSANFDLTGVAPGAYDVQATNGTGQHLGTAVCPGCFTVTAPAPTVTSVSPSTLGGGASNESVVVTGTNIFPGATVTFSSSKVTPVGSAVVNRTAGTVTQVVSVAPDATAAAGTVKVTNTDGQSASTAFSTAPAPSVSSLTPTQKASGTTFPLTVNGSGFTSSPAPTLSFDIAGVTTTTVAVNSGGTQLTTTVTLPTGAATSSPVAMHVVVINGDRGRASAPTAITVTPQPVVTSISTGRPDPTTAPAGQSVSLTVNGSAFQAGVTLAPQASSSGLTITSVTQVSAAVVTATVAVDPAAVAGPRTIVLSQPDGGSTTFPLTVTAKPTVPQNLVATPAVRSATVTWDAPAGGSAPTTYVVTLTNTVPGGANPPSQSVLSPRQATFNGLTDSTTYNVTVVASNDAGSSPAASGSVTTFSVPSAPTSLALTGGAHQITATWAAPASTGGSSVTSYTVKATNTTNPNDTVTSPAITATTYAVPGLASGASYAVSVVATNAVGSSPAATGTATTAAVPGAPTNLAAARGVRQLVVSWAAPVSDLPVSSYEVVAVNTADSTDTHDSGTLADTARTFTVTALGDGATYAVSVVATSAAGQSAPASVTQTALAPPGTPTSVSAAAGDRTVTVTFGAPASNGGSAVTGYHVVLAPGGAAQDVTAPGSVTFTGLTNGTAYTATVTATNAVGTSPAATAGPATPATVPGAPTSVSVAAGDAKVTVTFGAPASNGGSAVTGYHLVLTPGGASRDVTSPGSVTFTGLTNGTAYAATVTAINAAGTSPASSAGPVTPVTVPGAPTSVSAVAGDRTVTVTFGAPASNGGSAVTGYHVVLAPGGAAQDVTAPGSVTFTGLTNGTAYTATVTATNRVGTSSASAAPVTPRGVAAASIGAAPARVVYGTAVVLTTTVTRTDSSVPLGQVALQARNDNGSLVQLVTLSLSSSGTATYRLVPAVDRTYVWVYLGDARNATSSSAPRRVLVAPRVTFSAPAGSHRVNQVITGAVSPGKAGRTIVLYRITSKGVAVRIATTTISSHSTYRFSVRLPAGSMRVRVVVPASPNNVAGAVTFIVRRS